MLHALLIALALIAGDGFLLLAVAYLTEMPRKKTYMGINIIQGTVIWISANLLFSAPASGVISIAGMVLYFVWTWISSTEGRRLQAMLLLVLFRVLQAAASAAAVFLFQMQGIPAARLTDPYAEEFPFVCLVCAVLTIAAITAAGLLMKKAGKLYRYFNFRFWFFAAPAVQSVLLFALFLYHYLLHKEFSFGPVFFFCVLVCLCSDVFYLAAYRRYSATQSLELQLEHAQKQIDTQTVYFEQMRSNIQNVNQLRHDLNNQLQAACYLLEKGESDAVRSQLDLLKNSIADRVGPRFCGNLMVDAVLSEKAELCRRENIPLELDVVLPEELPVRGAHLCSIFSNLLDNAIHAVTRQDAKSQPIRLDADLQQGMLVIRCSNPADAPQKRQNDDPLRAHGLGLVILQQLAARYDGQFRTAYSDGVFTAVMMLNLTAVNKNS